MKRYANCMEVREEFSALLDGELSPEELEQVEGHLSECAECLRELDGFKRVDVAYGGLPSLSAPEDLEGRVRARIAPRTGLGAVFSGGRRARWVGAAAALAAVLLMVVGASFVVLERERPERFQTADATLSESVADRDEAMQFRSLAPPASIEVDEVFRDLKQDAAAEPSESVWDNFVGHRTVASKPKKSEVDALGRSGFAEGQSAAVGREDVAVAGSALVSEARKAAAPSEEAFEFERRDFDRLENLGYLESKDALGKAGTLEFGAGVNEALADREAVLGQPVDERSRGRIAGGALGEGEEAPGLAGADRFDDLSEDIVAEGQAVKTVWLRSFRILNGVWVERGYDGEPTKQLERGSDEVLDIVEGHADLRRVVERPAEAVFRVDGVWYRLPAIEE